MSASFAATRLMTSPAAGPVGTKRGSTPSAFAISPPSSTSKPDNVPSLPREIIGGWFASITAMASAPASTMRCIDGSIVSAAAPAPGTSIDLAIARAFDNRVGTWAVAETIRLLKAGKTKLNVEVCAVANTMEEVGLFGARQIAYSLHPDVALVMDVTHATDYPTVDKRQHGDIKVGEGPTVTHGNCNHPEVIKRIEQVAKRLKINLQHEAISATSGTDTDAIFWTRGGIPSGLISLPNRYMHSPVEVVSLKDLEQIPQIMAGFAKSIKRGEEFKVKI